MKAKLIQWTKPLLTACMALSLWFGVGVTSIIFFGEYEYPHNTEE